MAFFENVLRKTDGIKCESSIIRIKYQMLFAIPIHVSSLLCRDSIRKDSRSHSNPGQMHNHAASSSHVVTGSSPIVV